MRYRHTLLLAVLSTVAILPMRAAVQTPAAAAARPPNIIHIIADDVGYDDVGPFGVKDIPTPHLDRLAREGRRFTSFYAPHSTCTPSRASILTGAYAPRVGLPAVLFPDSRIGLNGSETTIAELLKTRGYATALIGKWHLGHLPPFLPTRHGFDYFYGIPYPNDHVPERLDKPGDPTAAGRRWRGFPPMPLIRQEEVIEQPAQMGLLPERFTADAVAWIEQHRAAPFYLQYSNIETHTPWLVTRPFQYTSKAGVYGDAVATLDWSVGQIAGAVARLGLDRDTLIVFTSDNGPLVHRYLELEGIYGHAAGVDTTRRHLLREGKYQAFYEGGTRVPCIVRWPGRVPAGGTSAAVVAGFDLYATFAALAGAPLPTDRVIDGRNIAPVMFGETDASPHDAFYYYQNEGLVAVRQGRWKLLVATPPDVAGSAGGARARSAGKPAADAPYEPILYDLDRDPGETRNVAAAHPDAVRALQAIAERARDDIGDARTKREGKNRRPPGRADPDVQPLRLLDMRVKSASAAM